MEVNRVGGQHDWYRRLEQLPHFGEGGEGGGERVDGRLLGLDGFETVGGFTKGLRT